MHTLILPLHSKFKFLGLPNQTLLEDMERLLTQQQSPGYVKPKKLTFSETKAEIIQPEVPDSLPMQDHLLSVYNIELKHEKVITGHRSPLNEDYVKSRSPAATEDDSLTSPRSSMFKARQKDLSLPSPRFGGWLTPKDCDCKHGLDKYQGTFVQGSAAVVYSPPQSVVTDMSPRRQFATVAS